MAALSLSLTLTLTLTLIVFPHIIPKTSSYPIHVWPAPTSFEWSHPQATLISPNFTIQSPRHKHLSSAVNRYLRLILTEHHRPLIPPSLILTRSLLLTHLTISVSDLSAPLAHGSDESYNLSIFGRSADLTAETPWGAMRGLETISQLVWGNPSRIGSGIRIKDAPKFGHRGVLLDTSRNFYPVGDLLRTIRAMSENKMNVFHWHVTDSHSFPLVLPSEPELARKGAYGDDMTYSPDDVKKVVEFGFDHGVRVLPEIDFPGHAGSWANAHPDIVTCANKFWWPADAEWSDRFASEPGTGQLNPLNPNTYKVVKNVIHDALSLFPESFYHAGSDEVVPGCWNSDPEIQSFLSKGGTHRQLLEKLINATLPYIASLNRTTVYWEDVLLDPVVSVGPASLPMESVVLQTWRGGSQGTKRVVQKGYRAIVSSSEYYYLDCGHGEFVGNCSHGGSWCDPFKTWQMVYGYDIAEGLSVKEARLVLGGEVALWSEQSDSTVLDSRIWPRGSAAAESLWSGNKDKKGNSRVVGATDRLNEWRYRMVRRGVGAEPIQPLWCIRNFNMCNTGHHS